MIIPGMIFRMLALVRRAEWFSTWVCEVAAEVM
jgi:hypothetical protein